MAMAVATISGLIGNLTPGMIMQFLLLDTIAILLYLLAVGVQAYGLFGKKRASKWFLLVLGLPAIVIHGFLLHQWIDFGFGQNLSFVNILSTVLWLVAVLILLTMLRKPVENLSIFVFPLAAVSIGLVLVFPGHHMIDTAANPKQLVHILLSIFTFSVLCVAAVQALLLAIQEYKLRHKTLRGILQALPPLETMEALLFQMVWIGFLLLTVVLLMSFYFFHSILLQQLPQQTGLIILAWLIFAALLVGRYLFGWRGRRAIYGTLIGVLLMVVAFFGSQLLLEFRF